MSLETTAAQLTAQQISDLTIELSFKAFLSMIATIGGFAGGVKTKNEIMKWGGFLIGLLGTIRLLNYLPQLIEIINISTHLR